ncbi:hypothetical protein An04g03450 [Aspergillus niger]|uniref:Uncharacterized protein n=2 Tax=Aspergillus niger TaxID=5061 RepID=A2QIG6_ASPNC|nr:hypothetical protein An04g03450 [Aspergillus niger]CAK38610.1 hypothetical protein An04g03450 [Aspergillus niger]
MAMAIAPDQPFRLEVHNGGPRAAVGGIFSGRGRMEREVDAGRIYLLITDPTHAVGCPDWLNRARGRVDVPLWEKVPGCPRLPSILLPKIYRTLSMAEDSRVHASSIDP